MGALSSIEVMKQAISSHQSAIKTTSHNISNVNTEGYSRQRVNYVETSPVNGVSRIRKEIPGQQGTGVKISEVERLRVSYLDYQYRTENSNLGYFETASQTLSRIENLMNEPSDTGLSNTMDQFWQSLQDLAVDPTSTGAREVVRQRGVAVAETFNYLADSLMVIKSDQLSEAEKRVSRINELAENITVLNEEIMHLEINGYVPNDMYDKRDKLVDELSNIVNIKVTSIQSDPTAPRIADGVYTIDIIGENGANLFAGRHLVDGVNKTYNQLFLERGVDRSIASVKLGQYTEEEVVTGTEEGGPPSYLFTGAGVAAADFSSNGDLRALVEGYGYEAEVEDPANPGETLTRAEGVLPQILRELDDMAYTFAGKFNEVHGEEAWSANEMKTGEDLAIPFFSDAAYERIKEYGTDQTKILFIVDDSGSMRENSEKVAGKLGDLAARIRETSDIENIQFGLMSYHDTSTPVYFDEDKTALWTTDADKILQKIENEFTFEGWKEDLIPALNDIIGEYGENDTFKNIIFITNENDDSSDLPDEVIQKFTERGIQVNGIYDYKFPDKYFEDLSKVEDVIEGTGGEAIDMNADNWDSELVGTLSESITNYIEKTSAGPSHEGYAARISVSSEVMADVNNIAASANVNGTGDNSNALNLANVFESELGFMESEKAADFRANYQRIIGDLGVMAEHAQRMENSTAFMKSSIQNNRDSVSAVSLDEEMTSLIQFQHAFNATARQITVMDEVLDRIINQM